MKVSLKKSWQVVVVAVVCVCLQTGCVKKSDNALVSSPTTTGTKPKTGEEPTTPTNPGEEPETNPMLGSTALKTFSEYYNALSLACGNPTVRNITAGGATSSSTTYLAQAAAVLPQTSSPGTLNDAVVQTYLKLASYRMSDCIQADAAKADAARLLLKGVNVAQPAQFSQTQAETVAGTMIQVFLHRPMSAEDKANVDELYQAFGTPTNRAGLDNLLVAMATGITASMEFAGKN